MAYYVSSGQISSGIILNNDSMYVSSGGTANDTTVNSGGRLDVSSGGTAIGVTVNYGSGLFLYGGYGKDVTIRNGASIVVGDQGILSNVSLIGQRGRGAGDILVSSGGKVYSATVGLYGDFYLFGTAEANHTVVNSGGILYCGFNDDWGYVYPYYGSRGGIANDTTLESGGSMRLYASGSASNVAVNSGATLTLSGGYVDKASVNSGGSMAVSSGGTALHASVYCASMEVSSSGFVENALVEASPGNHGWLVVYDGGTANNTTVKSSGHQEVSSGGIAANAILISGGGMGVSDGGFAYNTTVSDWWSRLKVYAGGTASDTIVNTSGSLYIYSTGKHTGSLQIAAGANIQASSGSIIDFDISSQKVTSPALINNLSLINGSPKYTITVSSTQVSGTYKLAENADGFNSSVTLTVGGIDYANALTVGSSYTVNDRNYSLDRDSSNTLTLTVGNSSVDPLSLVVTTASDVVDATDGVISLREAILYAANGTRAADGTATITFAESLGEEISISLDAGTVNIASGTWNQEFLTIDGGNRVVIHAENATGVLFRIENNNQVNIKNLTFSGDSETINPHETPVIFNLGTLLAENLEVVNNKTTGYCPGIWTPAGGNTTIKSCQFIGNLTDENSGAVRNEDGYVLIEDSLFRNNVANRFGGAIHNVFSNAEMVIRNTVFENNSAVNGGGAIYNFNNAELTVDGCSFTGNSASWGNSIWNGLDATSTVTNSHFYGDNTDAVLSFSVSNANVQVESNVLTATWDACSTAGVSNVIRIDGTIYDTEKPEYSTVLSQGNHEVYVGHKDGNGNYAWSESFTFSDIPDVPLDLLVVTTAADVVDASDGVTSLREAIAYAQTLGGEQTITFADDYHILQSGNRILLNSSNSAISFSGSLEQNIIIDGTNCSNNFLIHNYYSSESNFYNLTFQNYNDHTETSGSLLNWGTMSIGNCKFINDNCRDRGGALASGGRGVAVISVKNTVFESNTATVSGGAFFNDGLTCLVEDCVFSGNTAPIGGAICTRHSDFSNASTMTIKDCVFSTPSDSIYNVGELTLQGTISLAANFYTDRTVDATEATINYLISAYESANSAVLISDQAKINGASYEVTVAENQAYGTYLLAGNAAGFASAISLTIGEETYENALTVGNSYTAGDCWYTLAVDSSNTLTLTVTDAHTPSAGGVASDLNADGRADIVMTISQDGHGAYGATGAWLIQADQTPAWGDLTTRNSLWTVFGMGFSTSGKNTADVYAKSIDNVIGAWTTDDDGKVNGWETIGEFSSDTQIVGLGDFNGNGQTDLLLRNTNGAVGCFFTGGETTGWNYFQSLGDEWQLCAIGDLNGDGRDDVVLKHDAGFAGSWLTQADGTMAWADLDTLPEGFEIVGAGDFNGDGTNDVLLQKGNYFGAWQVYNGNARAWMGLGDLGDVTVEQIADFNGDGKDDLRIRTSAGDLGTQLVMGEDDLVWKYYGSVGSEWSTSLAALA